MANFSAHDSTVWSLAYSPDGKLLASASWDHTAKVWDATAPRGRALPLRATLQGHSDRLWWVGFAPDSKTLATTSEDKTVRIWDAEGKQQHNALVHEAPTYCAVFRPDGKLLATSTVSGSIRLFDTTTWDCRNKFDRHAKGVRLAFSPDGNTLASAGQDHVHGLWDVAKGERFASLTGFKEMLDGSSR